MLLLLNQKEDEDLFVLYTEFLTPEQTKGGRNQFHGKKELFRTDEVEKDYYTAIKGKMTVLKLDEYLACPNKTTAYFFRQKYDKDTGIFQPTLKEECVCNNPLNPDLPFLKCTECGTCYHLDCLSEHKITVCQDCDAQLRGAETTLLSHKRARESPKKKVTVQKPVEPELKYSTISLVANKKLADLTEKQSLVPSSKNSINPVEQARKHYRDIFIEVLLLAVFEAREREELRKIVTRSELLETEDCYKFAQEMVVAIETSLFIMSGEKIVLF